MERIPAEQPHEQFDRYLRTYNDTATWLAETLDTAMLTRFEYTSDGSELYASDGSPMSKIFLDSRAEAERIAAVDPSLRFEVRRRQHETDEYHDMLSMVRGELPNTTVVVSDFPVELTHAIKSVGGYNVHRKQTMLRVLAWDGTKLTMYSQSLDLSNRTALESIYRSLGYEPEAGELLGQRMHLQLDGEEQKYLTARLTGVYDRSLIANYGGQWHAGRQGVQHDAYEFVLGQHKLLDHFATRFMDRTPSQDDLYNMAALMEYRFGEFKRSGGVSVGAVEFAFGSIAARDLDMQLQRAGNKARAQGKAYDGCGMSVDASNDPQDQLHELGYGNRSLDDEDDLGSRWFSCPKGHMNYRRKANIPEKSCKSCGIDVSCKPPKPKPRNKSAWERFGEKKPKNSARANFEHTKNTAGKIGKKVLAGV